METLKWHNGCGQVRIRNFFLLSSDFTSLFFMLSYWLFIVLLVAEFIQAQTLGGQVTSIIIGQTVFTAEASAPTASVLPYLTSLDFSGLYATDPSSTATSSQRIITTTGSSAVASNFASSSKLSTTDTGIIIGGSIAGVIIILGITLCTCILVKRSRACADRLSFNTVSQEAGIKKMNDILLLLMLKKQSRYT
ncbi:unnamed protein product [Rhizopus stolonifer]